MWVCVRENSIALCILQVMVYSTHLKHICHSLLATVCNYVEVLTTHVNCVHTICTCNTAYIIHYMQASTVTHTQTHTYARTHAHTQTHTHMQASTHAHAHTHTNTHTHIRMYIYTSVHCTVCMLCIYNYNYILSLCTYTYTIYKRIRS